MRKILFLRVSEKAKSFDDTQLAKLGNYLPSARAFDVVNYFNRGYTVVVVIVVAVCKRFVLLFVTVVVCCCSLLVFCVTDVHCCCYSCCSLLVVVVNVVSVSLNIPIMLVAICQKRFYSIDPFLGSASVLFQKSVMMMMLLMLSPIRLKSVFRRISQIR